MNKEKRLHLKEIAKGIAGKVTTSITEQIDKTEEEDQDKCYLLDSVVCLIAVLVLSTTIKGSTDGNKTKSEMVDELLSALRVDLLRRVL